MINGLDIYYSKKMDMDYDQLVLINNKRLKEKD